MIAPVKVKFWAYIWGGFKSLRFVLGPEVRYFIVNPLCDLIRVVGMSKGVGMAYVGFLSRYVGF